MFWKQLHLKGSTHFQLHKEEIFLVLASVAQSVGVSSCATKFPGSIPDQGTYERKQIGCFFLSL